MTLYFDVIRSEIKDVVKQALDTKNASLIEAKQKSFNRTDMDLKSPLDQVFRDILLELIEQEVNVSKLEDLISLSIESCRKGLTSLSMPVILLADIFDLLTLDCCEKMFIYVEKQVNVWKEDLFFTSCKNNLLRMCNDLLRRLSRASATVFCGRILLFLAKFFPFSERSGLNIVSEFNLENVTEYGAESVDVEVLKDKEKDDKNKHVYIDYSLYCKFWSLQDFFRNPNQCYNKVQWKLFCSHANSIISTFQGLKLEHVDKQIPWLVLENEDISYDKTPYFSKYLTNQKLLDLQLYDVNFRRFVLLQFLILFQYLTSPVRFKTENYELKQDQVDMIQAMTERTYNLLKETPDGEHFSSIVSNILIREEYWNAWKNDGCPEFRKVLPASNTEVDKKRPENKAPFLGDIIKEARKNGAYHMGNTELTKLWNLYPDNLEACKAKDRDFLPSLDNYFADAVVQLDKLDSEEKNLLKDGNFGWRALRLLARRSPHFFTHSNKPISELHNYLEMMVRKIAADKPGTVEINDQNDAEIEEDLFKQPDETTEDMKNVEGDDVDENYIRFKVTWLTVQQFDTFCEKLALTWKLLAPKLGYRAGEVEFIVSQNPTDEVNQARSLLHLWFEDDDDSTLENFLYILEGLQLTEVADEVKLALEQNKNLNILNSVLT